MISIEFEHLAVKLEHLAIAAAGRYIVDDVWPPGYSEPSTDELRAFMAQLLGLGAVVEVAVGQRCGAPVPFPVPARDAWASISRSGNGRAIN